MKTNIFLLVLSTCILTRLCAGTEQVRVLTKEERDMLTEGHDVLNGPFDVRNLSPAYTRKIKGLVSSEQFRLSFILSPKLLPKADFRALPFLYPLSGNGTYQLPDTLIGAWSGEDTEVDIRVGQVETTICISFKNETDLENTTDADLFMRKTADELLLSGGYFKTADLIVEHKGPVFIATQIFYENRKEEPPKRRYMLFKWQESIRIAATEDGRVVLFVVRTGLRGDDVSTLGVLAFPRTDGKWFDVSDRPPGATEEDDSPNHPAPPKPKDSTQQEEK